MAILQSQDLTGRWTWNGMSTMMLDLDCRYTPSSPRICLAFLVYTSLYRIRRLHLIISVPHLHLYSSATALPQHHIHQHDHTPPS